GYLNDRELTDRKFRPHPRRPGERMYLTGDLGRWKAEGVVEYLGRKDDQLKIRGYRVEPAEIERSMRVIAGGREGAVVATGRDGGERALRGYYTGDASPETVRAQLRRVLPEYMVPSSVNRLERMPLNRNGKVDRGALPALPPRRTRSMEAPADAVEETIVSI